ncbi:MAG: benzoate/H(+) symporter BenE family transporter [Corynebacterium casei]|uniref:benzoate/H(+) symporter BenE family transporter n=1 Tax=Corynebacterium casei TaxID=160386 RepID=UPI002648AF7A|nr:benzoate/H(+) symporter BenE family transporter [Corynebacterium casei]MDN5903591.1 benzoate/H(+) symporter BenE family transporter [Corynebacterium casei]MDN6629391.1 benzoate/H(+) symporter BenE family transporter [Corynebacterium casei]MDN6674704.1 benzoate/H(+) symporter BenE family transporter [Corynebacterium casei]MDN6694795.1 benzoate/H(+) symporter BenE family transporter [Corynebacterium casei]
MPKPGESQSSLSAIAGITTGLVGFLSSFVIVIAMMQNLGATDGQIASGLLVVCFAIGITTLFLSYTSKAPITIAWSTPGAALIAGAFAAGEGDSEMLARAMGAFIVAGILLIATGLIKPLAALVSRIPSEIAQAMLAGFLLAYCTEPMLVLASEPWLAGPVIVVWLLALWLAPRWAIPAAFVASCVVIALNFNTEAVEGISILPHLEFVMPSIDGAAIVNIALPLYLVTMASQNLPGLAILKAYHYKLPWKRSMVTTGFMSSIIAPFGGLTINLAAISAALSAGSESGVEHLKRWRSAMWSGYTYITIGLFCSAVVVIISAAPSEVFGTLAGLALVGTFAGSVAGAWKNPAEHSRMPAAVTFIIAASGVTIFGIGAAIWSIAGGLIVRGIILARKQAQEDKAEAHAEHQ